MLDGELEGSLLSVIKSSGGNDLMKEAAEFSLDSILNNGFVKDIPVVGTIANLYKGAIAVQGYVFAKKIRKFLTELTSIPKRERDDFSKKLEIDKKLHDRTAEVLITLLDKLDDLEKAPLLARAFSGYIRNEYDFITFQRLAASVDRCLINDIPMLERLQKPMGLDTYIGDVLVSAGLATIDAIPLVKSHNSKTVYKLSPLGHLFLQVVVKGLPREE